MWWELGVYDSLKRRRSYYKLGTDYNILSMLIDDLMMNVAYRVPDVFGVRTARIAILRHMKHKEFWDKVYELFKGKVPRERIEGLKWGTGTILFFYDEAAQKELQAKYPEFANQIPIWVREAGAMLQMSEWLLLGDMGMGGCLQHYNPVIEDLVHQMTGYPESYILTAQMPFGSVEGPAREKEDTQLEERKQIKIVM